MMQKLIKYSAACIILILFGCSNKTIDNSQNSDQQINSILFLDNLHSNLFFTDEIIIDSAFIEENTLVVDVSYFGGCNDHQIKLYALNNFAESLPVQLLMRISHNSHKDSCEALMTTKLQYDLIPVVKLYREYYGDAKGKVLFSIYDSKMENLYLPRPLFEF